MFSRNIKALSKSVIISLSIFLLGGILFGFCEFISGKHMRYSLAVGQLFQLITEDMETTALYGWELDYFRITSLTTVGLSIASFFVYMSTCHKYKRFDNVKLIISFVSIVLVLNFFISIYYFLFFMLSGYLISGLIWLTSIGITIISINLIIKLSSFKRNYRSYDLEVKAFFHKIPSKNILGFFNYNEYEGIIVFDPFEKCIFGKINSDYVIYVNVDNILEVEEVFIKKLGYWAYYIKHNASRYSQKEIDYHDNALVYSDKFYQDVMEFTKISKKSKKQVKVHR